MEMGCRAKKVHYLPRHTNDSLQPHFPVGLFDGDAQSGKCGCGAEVRINPKTQYLLH